MTTLATLAVGAGIVALSVTGFFFMAAAETSALEAGSDFTSSDFLTRAPSTNTDGPARLRFVGPEGVEVLQNGETIAVGEDLFVTVSVSPYPPSDFNVDVDLHLTDATGTPVTDASVTSDWDMIFMFHGPFSSSFAHVGAGHYTASFDLFMFGPWEFVTDVNTPAHEEPETLTLSIYVWPE